jgi:hypothetical protein
MKTLSQQDAQAVAERQRSAYEERFTGQIAELKERIAELGKSRPDTSVLVQIGDLVPSVPVAFHVRPGFGFGGGGIARDMLRHVILGALDDARIKNEQIDEEIAQAKHKLQQIEAGLARLQ